ncbi:MAG: SLBB domain-containing protein [Desulfobacca sp.]|uniref:SLBB domain-containing protein n=1 Tax=Desulfobacca sp. TaxID=2067990 RepID=UPI00404B7FDC
MQTQDASHGPYSVRRPRGLLGVGLVLGFLCPFFLAACGYIVSPKPNVKVVQNDQFALETQMPAEQFAKAETVKNLSEKIKDEYRLGPGDILRFNVWHRPEISNNNIVVSPDGYISIMRLGLIKVEGKTLAEVTKEITDKLSVLYERPEVNISIEKYNNNKVFVLGRVTSPGVVNLPGPGTLLEALAMAGGLPVLQKEAFLTRCSIIRGKDTVIWIDLQELLNKGNMSLNARLQNRDIVFIPESADQLVYVMGEVARPGALRLTAQFSYLDAIMQCGGPTKDANLRKTYLVRFDGKKGTVKQIDIKKMVESGMITENYILKDNDVIYVAPTGMAKFNYAMQQILPSLAVLNLATGTVQGIRGMVSPSAGVAVNP